MFEQSKTAWNKERIKRLTDIRNIVLYVFALIVLAITWSGVKTIQSNYELQKKISAVKQQNAVLQLANENKKLQNKYLESDQYLELAARQNLGLAAPGEKVLLVPERVALKYISQTSGQQKAGNNSISKHIGTTKNLEDWRDFLLGRNLLEN